MTSQNPYGGFDAPRDAFWLFAYGSLMWEPNFPFVEKFQRVIGAI